MKAFIINYTEDKHFIHSHRTNMLFLLCRLPLRILGSAPGLKGAHHLLAAQLLTLHHQPLSVDCHGKNNAKSSENHHRLSILARKFPTVDKLPQRVAVVQAWANWVRPSTAR